MVVQLLHPLWLLPWAPHCYSINVQMGIVSPLAAPQFGFTCSLSSPTELLKFLSLQLLVAHGVLL